MRTTLARPLALAAVLGLALVAAGCGGGGSSSGTTTGTSGTASGGTLRVAIGSQPPSLDPGLATDTTSAYVVENIHTPILYPSPSPDLKPQPRLAENWGVEGASRTP